MTSSPRASTPPGLAASNGTALLRPEGHAHTIHDPPRRVGVRSYRSKTVAACAGITVAATHQTPLTAARTP
jgi:hypothetical protein